MSQLSHSAGGPERLGKYRLVRPLAMGGMGELFLARHEGPAGFAKTLVVKRILPHLAQDQAFIDLFLNEARLAALLAHPNVVQIFELGMEAGHYFIAMEYIHGRSLRALEARLRERGEPASPELAAYIGLQTLQGLEYAHHLRDEKGRLLKLVHRDISPDNVLVAFSAAVKVVDFGVAKAMNFASSVRSGVLKGKCSYMAPEQLEDRDVDARTDVYSMGVVLYELLVGQRPFQASSEPALIHAILTARAPRLREVNPRVPEGLALVVEKAICRDAEGRFSSAAQMAAALGQWLSTREPPYSAAALSQQMLDLFGPEAAIAEEYPADRAAHAGTAVGAPLTAAGVGENGPPRRSRVWVAAAVGLAVGGAALAFVWNLQRGSLQPRAEDLSAASGSAAASERPAGAALPLPKPPASPPSALPGGAAARAGLPAAKRHLSRSAQSNARAGATGRVELRIRPWAEVFLGKERLGITPIEPVEVPAGEHTFVLRNLDLGVERRVRITVPAGGDVTLKADLLKP